MRLAMLGMYHETNTFAPHRADRAVWERSGIQRGAEIIGVYGASEFSLAGFLDRAAQEPDVEIVPLLFTTTGPQGYITEDAFESIVGEMLTLLRDHGPWDGVLLVQHGAMVAEHIPDADAEVIARVRAIVGPDVPIGVASDLHGNITARFTDNCTCAVFFRTNPHLDAKVRAAECADIIIRTVRGEINPVQAVETPPLMVNITQQGTGAEPMRSMMRDIDAVLQRPGMLSASIVMGYPYADVPGMGMAFLAVHDGDPMQARQAARWLADRAWERRAEFVGETPTRRRHCAMRRAPPAPGGADGCRRQRGGGQHGGFHGVARSGATARCAAISRVTLRPGSGGGVCCGGRG